MGFGRGGGVEGWVGASPYALDGVLAPSLERRHVGDSRRGSEQVGADDRRVSVDPQQCGEGEEREGQQRGHRPHHHGGLCHDGHHGADLLAQREQQRTVAHAHHA